MCCVNGKVSTESWSPCARSREARDLNRFHSALCDNYSRGPWQRKEPQYRVYRITRKDVPGVLTGLNWSCADVLRNMSALSLCGAALFYFSVVSHLFGVLGFLLYLHTSFYFCLTSVPFYFSLFSFCPYDLLQESYEILNESRPAMFSARTHVLAKAENGVHTPSYVECSSTHARMFGSTETAILCIWPHSRPQSSLVRVSVY
jgi:hypothetical protein